LSIPASAAGISYPDVAKEYWAWSDIQSATEYGLMQGYENGTFGPEDTLNRASFVTVLQRMFGWKAVVPASPSFTDCSPGAWYYSAVETAAAHGITEGGVPFRPSDSITREEMAVMLVRALGYGTLASQITECPFPDVTSNPGAIALAYAIGMTTGIVENERLLFKPDSTAVRAQAAAMLVRVYQRYTSRIDWLHGFYAFASYPQIGFTDQMDGVSVGWARMCFDPSSGPWLNDTSSGGNDWVKPSGADSVTRYFAANGTPCNLNVYATTAQNVTLSDGTTTSVVASVTAPAQRAAAISALVSAAGDYAGLTIDFEGMKSDLKDQFTAFMQELRDALPASKTLYVCVPPDKWYTGFDYRALGEVCDKVILMAHDYQWTSIPASYVGTDKTNSPVTPFSQIYTALCHITDADTGVQDRSKLALAISFGTAGFHVDENGILLDTTIYHPSQTVIATRLAQPDTTVTYSDLYRNPCMTYTTEDGSRYLLWYENAQSVSDKLTLARMFGITGISVWRLGNIPNVTENPALNYDVWGAIQAQR
jgi:hypothetical protein